jgi:hypothetical protein
MKQCGRRQLVGELKYESTIKNNIASQQLARRKRDCKPFSQLGEQGAALTALWFCLLADPRNEFAIHEWRKWVPRRPRSL